MSKFKIPEGFSNKYAQILPEDKLKLFLGYSQKPLRKSIRVNTLVISVADFKSLAFKKNWQLEAIPWCSEGFWLERENRSVPLGKTAEHALGYFFIQEASSMLPSSVLLDKEDQSLKILDLCAAPGAKTTHLAAKMANNALIWANEFSASRIKKLAFNLTRNRVMNVVLTQNDGEKLLVNFGEYFERILIDAPCTGEGTVRKDPQALANWSEKRILLAAKLQKKLMTAAFEALAVGGELVYSTCTLAPEENEKVVEYLLQKFPGLAQVVDLSSSFVGAKQAIALGDQGSKMLRLWPQVFDSEGFFVAKIRKAKSTNFNAQQNRSSLKKFNWSQKSKLKPISKKDQQRLADFLALEFGFDLSLFQGRILTQADHKRQIKVGVKVFIVPEDFESKGQKFDRAGILLGEIYRHDLRLDHELAVCVGHLFTKRIIELTREDLLIYYQGLDLAKSNYRELQDLNSGQLAVKYEGQVVGLVKIIGSRLKNLLPRKFVQEII